MEGPDRGSVRYFLENPRKCLNEIQSFACRLSSGSERPCSCCRASILIIRISSKLGRLSCRFYLSKGLPERYEIVRSRSVSQFHLIYRHIQKYAFINI